MTGRVVVAYVPDLMDRSRLSAAVPDVRYVGRAGAALEAIAGMAPAEVLVICDLARPDAMDLVTELVAGGVPVVAFGPHVERAELADAARAGARVLARSAFFAGLPSILDPTA